MKKQKSQRGEAVTSILILNLIVSLIPQIQKISSDGKPVCGEEGYLREPYNLTQIINEKGGGIPCYIIKDEKKGEKNE